MSDLTPYQPGTPFLQQFRIVKKIGSGGMATVYEIEHLPTGKTAALKLLDFSKAKKWDSEEEQEFKREAEALRSISHPNVVGYGHSFLEDVGGYGSAFHLLLELIKGKSVKEVIDPRGNARYHFSPDEIDKIILQSVDGLDAAHERGIVHRDPTPHNIMLEYPGDWQEGQPFAFERVVVTDFGVARLRPHVTGSETIIGKANYLAPEQRRNESTSPATDWYILAETAIAAATHREPPIFDDPRFQASETSKYDPISLIQRATNIHPATKKVLEAMLRENKKDRPQRAEDVRRLLVQNGGTLGRYNPETRLYEMGEKTPAEHSSLIAAAMDALEEVQAEKKLPGPAQQETFTTALAKPMGTLVPEEMDVAVYALTNADLPWYVRHAGKIGAGTGIPSLEGIIWVMGSLVGYIKGYPLQEIIQKSITGFATDWRTAVPVALASLAGGVVWGSDVGKKFKERYEKRVNKTRALAAEDDSYQKKTLMDKLVGFYNWHFDNFLTRRLRPLVLLSERAAIGAGIGYLVGGIKGGMTGILSGLMEGMVEGVTIEVKGGGGITTKRQKFRENLTDFIAQQFREDAFTPDGRYSNISEVLTAVEKEYGIRARQTFAHNYAHKMLEQGRYDEVVTVGVQVLDYVSGKKQEGYFAGRKAQRGESELLENICLGLVRKGALDELWRLTMHWTAHDDPRATAYGVKCETVIGQKKMAVIDKLARDRLREVHHNLYGRNGHDENVQQYTNLCRTFGMEPNLEKLTRALVPEPVEEAGEIRTVPSGLVMGKLGTYREFKRLIEMEGVERTLGTIQQQDGWKKRQMFARAYAAQNFDEQGYAVVVEIIKYVLQRPANAVEEERKAMSYPSSLISSPLRWLRNSWALPLEHTENDPIYKSTLKQEVPHIEELLYGLLNKGAWKELAELRSKNRGVVEVPVLDIALGFKRLTEFDDAVRKRLEEVRPYLSKASMTELGGYESACYAFDYKRGLQEVVEEQTLRTAPPRENW